MHSLDCRAAPCPTPLLQTKLWLRQLATGAHLLVRLADSTASRDVVRFLESQPLHRLTVVVLKGELIVSLEK